GRGSSTPSRAPPPPNGGGGFQRDASAPERRGRVPERRLRPRTAGEGSRAAPPPPNGGGGFQSGASAPERRGTSRAATPPLRGGGGSGPPPPLFGCVSQRGGGEGGCPCT